MKERGQYTDQACIYDFKSFRLPYIVTIAAMGY